MGRAESWYLSETGWVGELLKVNDQFRVMNERCTRRDFCRTVTLGSGALLTGMSTPWEDWSDLRGKIITVTGPIDPQDMGVCLPHEHVLVDFIGADKTGAHRYDADQVKQRMIPYLAAIKNQGVKAFIDCTPNYLARDPLILRDLAQKTGLHILTNTGLYKEPFLPPYAFEKSARELADHWTDEIINGIADTKVHAGFIKIAVFPEPLKPIQQKIVRAAAMTHLQTGAAIACHTAYGPAALQILAILESEKAPPESYIFVHAGDEQDTTFHTRVARAGAWVEFDDIGSKPVEHHLKLVQNMLDAGLENRLLLSQDRGWYSVGEADGGEVKPFDYFFTEFVPAMLEGGIPQPMIDKITRINPAQAFRLTSS